MQRERLRGKTEFINEPTTYPNVIPSHNIVQTLQKDRNGQKFVRFGGGFPNAN